MGEVYVAPDFNKNNDILPENIFLCVGETVQKAGSICHTDLRHPRPYTDRSEVAWNCLVLCYTETGDYKVSY